MTVSEVYGNKASPAKKLLSALPRWNEAELSKQGPISTFQQNSLDDDVGLAGTKATRSEGGRWIFFLFPPAKNNVVKE